MKGMISTDVVILQQQHLVASGSNLSIEKWSTGLITKLLEVTHSQWLYRNVVVHGSVSCDAATKRKEEIQMEVEQQQEQGETGLLEEDRYLI